MKTLIKLKFISNLALISVLLIGITCVGVKNNSTGKYAHQKAATSGPSPSQEEWAGLVGEDKAEILFEELGQDTLDLLTFGAGVSNMVELINGITDVNKLTALIGNNYPAGSETGLGPLRTLALLNGIDDEKQANMSTNIQAAAPPANQDTISAMIYFVENVSLADVNAKVIPLIDDAAALNVDRDMDSGAATGPEHDKVNKLARVLAHSHRTADADLDKLISLISGAGSLCPADVINRVGAIMNGVTSIDVLIETLDKVTNSVNLIDVIKSEDPTNCGNADADPGVAAVGDLILVMNQVSDGTKLGYVINNVTTTDDLVVVIDDISNPVLLGDFINLAEDNQGWGSQVNGPWLWGNDTLGEPDDADSTIPRVVALINALSGSGDKLADLLEGVTDQNKMVRIIQDVVEPADLSYVIDNTLLADVPKLTTILNDVTLANIIKMRELIDGQRVNGNVGTQNPTYLDKLVTLIANLLVASEGPEKVSQMVNQVTTPDKIIDLVYDVTTTSNLSDIINNVHASSLASPQDNAVNTLVTTIEDIAVGDIPKLVYMIDFVDDPADMSDLVNSIAEGEGGSAGGTTAGDKLVDVIEGVSNAANPTAATPAGARNLEFVIDNVSNISQMADLIVALPEGVNGTDKLGTLIDTVDSDADGQTNTWNAADGSRGGATDMGKIVNMIDYTTAGNGLQDVAHIVENVTDINKMSALVNDVTNSSNLVGMLNEVLTLGTGVRDNLETVINGIDGTDDVPKLVAIVNNVGSASEAGGITTGHADHVLVAELMQNVSGATQGIGTANMISLIGELGSCSTAQYTETDCAGVWTASDTAAAIRLAEVMTGLNTNVCYNEPCGAASTPRREGLVRMVEAGVTYDPTGFNVSFNGLGADHLALMMNQATSSTDLTTMINGTDISDVVVIVGCGDHVSGFQTPCGNIGEGWP